MKKLIAVILSIAMILSMLVLPASAEADGMKTGTIHGYKYYYTDYYFAGDSSVYDPSLATMSFILSAAGNAESGDNWTHQYAGLLRAFSELGFVDAEVNEDFRKKPTTDSLGVGVAHKTIVLNGQTYTLLALAPRMNYMAEWASNFTIGTSGEAQGFSNSAKIAETFLNEYIAKYSSSFEGELKLWIVGYSRGAAITNLIAGHIDEAGSVGGIPVSRENIFAYTFETPKAANTSLISQADAQTYTNIHNVLSANDVVAKVAPEQWGFLRYGTDESVVPEVRTAENNAIFEAALQYLPESLAAYNEDGQRIFASEQFQAKSYSVSAEDHRVNTDKTMSEFLNDLLKAAATGIGSRTSYTYFVQDTLRLILSEVAGDSYQSALWETAKVVLKEELQDKAIDIITLACSGKEDELTELLTEIFDKALEESGLDKAAYEALPGQIVSLIPILVNVILADVAIDNGSDIITLIDNLDLIANPHYGEQVTAWLMALDPNYNPEAANYTSAAVTGVNVNITKVTTTKKLLLSNLTVTRYETEIVPVVSGSVRKVEYRKILIGRMTEGTCFTQDVKPTYLYIDVTDINGNVTHWEYKNGTVKQVNK